MSAAEPIGVVDAIAEKRAMVLNAARAGGMSETEMRRRMGLPPLPVMGPTASVMARSAAKPHPLPVFRVPPTRPTSATYGRASLYGQPVHRDVGKAIITAVADSWDVTEPQIKGHFRGQYVAYPRRQAIAAAHMLGYGFAPIGRWIGRDHTSTMHAVMTHRAMLAAAYEDRDASLQNDWPRCADYAARWSAVVAALDIAPRQNAKSPESREIRLSSRLLVQ